MPENLPHEPVSRPIFVKSPPAVATIIFDADCSFCRRWVERWKGLSGDRVKFVSFQDHRGRFPEIPLEQLQQAVHLVEHSGRVSRGARAVFKLLHIAGQHRWLLTLYDDMPTMASASEAGYRLVAGHRNLFDRIDLFLFGRNPLPVTHQITRRWFLRLLGMVYVFAFASLWVQIVGLVGSRGILPIAPQLRGLAAGEGGTPYFQMPTIFWINASDGMLVGVCAAGVGLAVMLMLRIAPAFAAFGAWFCYLSLAIAGQVFLAYQWDALLIEAGFLAIFLSPLQLLPRKDDPAPSRLIIWLYRWLLFRLVFLAGLVKLLSGDNTWRNLTALHYHYWTQPLPTPLAWYANRLPYWFSQLSVVTTFYIELIVPLFFFAPRQLRRYAFCFTVAFQLLIILTGNYGFFNVLAIVLCLMLLDDTFWPLRRRTKPAGAVETAINRQAPSPAPPARHPFFARPAWSRWYILPVAGVLFFATTVQSFHRIGMAGWIPAWADGFVSDISSFRSTNAYGLFEVMTTRRPEIIVEGSEDCVTWQRYEFKWKPVDVDRAPAFCTPHLPRLDWQMWFGGLGMEHDEWPRWLVQLLQRLLEGSPTVADLMGKNPFPAHPPRYIRATVYYYRFTTSATEEKAWWTARRSDYVLGPLLLSPSGELAGQNPR